METAMATISWISLTGGDWADGVNWQGNVVPGPLDDAVLSLLEAETITVSDLQNLHSVSFHDPAASYVVTSSGTLSAAASIVLDGAAITVTGAISASNVQLTSASGILVLNSGSLSNTNTNSIATLGGLTLGSASGTIVPLMVSAASGPTALSSGAVSGAISTTLTDLVISGPTVFPLNVGSGVIAQLRFLPIGATHDAIVPGETIYSGGFGSHVRLSSASALFFGNPLSGDFITDGGTGSTIMGGGGLTRVDVTNGVPLVFGGSGSLMFSGTNLPANPFAAPTVVGGGGTASVFANAGGGQFWCGPGDMLFVGGSGGSTVTAGFGRSTLFGGTGRDLLVSNTGFCTMVGGGDGAVLVAGSNSFSNVLVAGGGNETLVGAANPFGNLMFAGTGSDVMFGGAGRDTFVAAGGDAQMIAGSGVDEFIFSNEDGGGRTVIWNFAQGLDHAALFGYGVNAVRDAVANASVAFGSTTITLSDNTRVTFANVTKLTAQDFL